MMCFFAAMPASTTPGKCWYSFHRSIFTVIAGVEGICTVRTIEKVYYITGFAKGNNIFGDFHIFPQLIMKMFLSG